MKVAIMQPYIFPYIGYFQLLSAVDQFVFYDDVNFIKQGWINRNKILINGKESVFTIPIKKASSFELIIQTELHPQLYNKWLTKFFRTLNQSYGKSPYFDEVFPIIKRVFQQEFSNISELSAHSVIEVSKYLELEKKFHSSNIDFLETKGLDRADRLIAITKKLSGVEYINALGGRELYHKSYFRQNQISLKFLEPKLITYNQLNTENFTPGLSIIDILFNNSKLEVLDLINNFKLI